MEAAEEDLLGFMAFPKDHWSKLRSTNPLERVNREIGRRSDLIGIYPNDAALIRLASMLLLEQTTSGSSLAATSARNQSTSSTTRAGPAGRATTSRQLWWGALAVVATARR